MALATTDHEAAPLVLRRRSGLGRAVMATAVAVALTTACSGGAGNHDPSPQAVSSGEVRLDVSPSFRAVLSEYGLHMVWRPPPCSWRLAVPACGGAATTDPGSVAVPVVGGEVSVWKHGQKLRGRLELAGQLELTGPQGSLPLDDLTLNPERSVLTAGTPKGRIDALFLDGTVASFPNSAAGVQMNGVEVKLLRELDEQLRSVLGVAQSSELVKVGDLVMTVKAGSPSGARG